MIYLDSVLTITIAITVKMNPTSTLYPQFRSKFKVSYSTAEIFPCSTYQKYLILFLINSNILLNQFYPMQANCWVEPSFSNLLAGKSPESKGKLGKPRKRKGETNSSALQSSSVSVVPEPHQSDHNVPWVDAHAPRSQVNHFTHEELTCDIYTL